MLRTHYRQPIDWTVRRSRRRRTTLDRWYDAIGDAAPADEIEPAHRGGAVRRSEYAGRARRTASSSSTSVSAAAASVLKASANFWACLQQTKAERDAAGSARRRSTATRSRRLIAGARAPARHKNWAESDRLRDELAEMGVALKDYKDGTTTWEVKR